jgi:hypothetical protein
MKARDKAAHVGRWKVVGDAIDFRIDSDKLKAVRSASQQVGHARGCWRISRWAMDQLKHWAALLQCARLLSIFQTFCKIKVLSNYQTNSKL